MADHVVGAGEATTFVLVDQRFHLAVSAHARDEPAVAFAQDQSALQVEGRAVAAERVVPYHLRWLPRRHAEQFVLADIDEVPIAVGMPQGAFGEDEAGGETL